MRRAEARVYDQIANSDRPGLALYELELGHPVPELDFALWLEGVGHYGLQVKGGRHSYTEGQWFLHVDGAPQAKPDPALSTWDAAMGIRDVIARRLGHRIYIVPALVFPDMDPDEDIDTRMSTRKVSVLWGSHDLIDRLIALPANRKIFHPPTAPEVREEVDLVTGGLLSAGPGRTRRSGGAAPRGTGRPAGDHPARGVGSPGGFPAGNPRRRHNHPPRGYPDRPYRPRTDTPMPVRTRQSGNSRPGPRSPHPCVRLSPGLAARRRVSTQGGEPREPFARPRAGEEKTT